MSEIQSFLERTRQLIVQHAPNDVLESALPVAIVCLVAGVGLSVLGAKLSRVGLTTAVATAGGYLGLFIGREIGFAPVPCGLIGAAMAGIIGYQTFRIWVGVAAALVFSTAALGFFGYHQVLPYVEEFESQIDATPSIGSVAQGSFALHTAAVQKAGSERTLQKWVQELLTYVAKKDAKIPRRGRALGLMAFLGGLFFGVLAMRTALIVSTSVVGTALVTTATGTLLTQHVPQFYSALHAKPATLGMVIGAFFVGSLVVQALVTRKAPSPDKSSKASKS